MSEFLQQFLNGLALGAIYALIALGYTMVYGVLRFINFAHSDIFMVGAFAAYYFAKWFGRVLPPESIVGATLITLASMATCALLGVVIEKLAYRPLRDRSKLNVLITAIGVSLFLEYSGQLVFGADPKTFSLLPSRNVEVGDLVLNSNQLIVFGMTLVLLLALRYIVMRTRIGTAMRAVSFNHQAAALMGINIDSVISFTFALGSALAAAGGILYAMNYPAIDPLMGVLPGLKAFVAAVLGGIGNIPGAALGGVLLGLVESFVRGSRFSTYADAIAFAILILILLFRPAGIMGKRVVEKV
ncbi:MAG: branched-chain amino acid ABC transporter permease [Verrucomicrobiales bacterium]|nr:branched-chain amino acid ABC transporter permease [Verrucomicrobiales bacterium]